MTFPIHPMIIGGEKPLWWIEPDDPNRILNPGPLTGNFEEIPEKTIGLTDFIELTAANQPLMNANGFGTGLNSMQTDKNNGLEKLVSAAPNQTIPAEMTYFLLFKFTADSVIPETTLILMYNGVGGGPVNYYELWVESVTGKLYSHVVSGVDGILSDNVIAVGSIYLAVIRYSRSRNRHDMRINMVNQVGVAGASITVIDKTITLGNHLGFPRCGDIDYGRFVGYGKYLEDHQVVQLERWYYNYYGL